MDAGPGFTFAPVPEDRAATEACSWRGRVMRGEAHDENCFALRGARRAGSFGTVDFAAVMLSRRPGPSAEPLPETGAAGWDPGWSGARSCADATIGHTGFAGVGLWIEFAAGAAWTFLTNRVHPTRRAETGVADLRRGVGEALFTE